MDQSYKIWRFNRLACQMKLCKIGTRSFSPTSRHMIVMRAFFPIIQKGKKRFRHFVGICKQGLPCQEKKMNKWFHLQSRPLNVITFFKGPILLKKNLIQNHCLTWSQMHDHKVITLSGFHCVTSGIIASRS